MKDVLALQIPEVARFVGSGFTYFNHLSSIFGAVSDAELKTKPPSIDVCSQVPAKTCPKIH
jgi:hypothetical protein